MGRKSDQDGIQMKTEISKSKCQMNFKAKNRILKSETLNLFQGKVQNDTLVMPNQVLNLIQDLRFRHLICDLHLI